ncbi:MAG: transporter substrate-binding domain-containing protein [Pseudomonadales bacterium]|nr:transporter substrate-binding domain-containing protein [Pseudomonadales bacterium]
MSPTNFLRRCYSTVLLCLMLVFSLHAGAREKSATGADKLLIGVPNNFYAELRSGEPLGIVLETLDALLSDMGFERQYVSMSNSEMKAALKKGSIDIATSQLVSQSDEKSFHSLPMVREYNVLLVSKQDEFSIETLADLRGLRLGGREGFRYPLIEADEKITIERNRKDGENIRKLFLGELDAAIVGSVSDSYEFRSEGVFNDVRLIEPAVGFVDIGVRFSRQSFEQSEIDRFNQALESFIGGAAWERILEKNGSSDLVREWPVIAADAK